ENVRLHSGAGRFAVLQMDTMTWQELGYSSGTVKLSDLLQGSVHSYYESAVSLDFIAERLCVGGWPALIGTPPENAIKMNQGYVDLLCEVDMSQVSGVKRNPQKVRNL